MINMIKKLSLASILSIGMVFFAKAQTPNVESQPDVTITYALIGLVLAVIGGIMLMVLKIINTRYRAKGKQLLNWSDINGTIALAFLVAFLFSVAWQYNQWGAKVMAPGGSAHADVIDSMLIITITITTIVFVITHMLLFGFAFLYRKREGQAAYYYPDNNRLEFFWTIIPAIVLTCLVTYGAVVWTNVTQPDEIEMAKSLKADAVESIELYAYQFGWKVRLAGNDNQLGKHNYKLIGGANDMGIDTIDTRAQDDLRANELVLLKGKPVLLRFRSQDVIHSAYIPTMRVQMNVVPGMPTQFYFVPTVTTDEMKDKRGDYAFEYILLCNKICGGAHYNMKLKIRVVDQIDYDKWYAKQKYYFPKPEPTKPLQVDSLTAIATR